MWKPAVRSGSVRRVVSNCWKVGLAVVGRAVDREDRVGRQLAQRLEDVDLAAAGPARRWPGSAAVADHPEGRAEPVARRQLDARLHAAVVRREVAGACRAAPRCTCRRVERGDREVAVAVEGGVRGALLLVYGCCRRSRAARVVGPVARARSRAGVAGELVRPDQVGYGLAGAAGASRPAREPAWERAPGRAGRRGRGARARSASASRASASASAHALAPMTAPTASAGRGWSGRARRRARPASLTWW